MNQDFSDLLSAFNAHHVEYLVVGAHALAVYGHLRATKDLDIWINPTEINAPNILKALQAFGAPLQNLTKDDLSTPGIVFQIGIPPARVDLITHIEGVQFADAWPKRFQSQFEGQPVWVISKSDFILNKRASGRTQDLADIEHLEKLNEDIQD